MDTTQITEKMPEFVKQGIGQAQKRLTLIEGQARELVTGTWTKVRAAMPIKAVEQTIEGWRKSYEEAMDVDKLRKAAEDTASEVSNKAFKSVGIATAADLRKVERKIDRLRSDVRKLNRKGKPKPKGNKNTKTTKTRTRSRGAKK
jgi:hypothetical protein